MRTIWKAAQSVDRKIDRLHPFKNSGVRIRRVRKLRIRRQEDIATKMCIHQFNLSTILSWPAATNNNRNTRQRTCVGRYRSSTSANCNTVCTANKHHRQAAPVPVCLKAVLQRLDAPTAQLWNTLDICPRTCPSQDATLCTYHRWFTKPPRLSRSVPLLQLPLSARCLRVLLRFRMGCHSLPIVCGRRSGIPRPQRICPHCASNVVGD